MPYNESSKKSENMQKSQTLSESIYKKYHEWNSIQSVHKPVCSHHENHFYHKYSSTFWMILFARPTARLAWSLVYALDGIWVPSGYFIFLTPWVRFSRSVASRRNSLGRDWARLARFSERLTFLASSIYCQAIKAFSVACDNFKKKGGLQ